MTDHPLTDEAIVELIGGSNLVHCLTEDEMRTVAGAADYQLKQVIKWLDDNLRDYLHEFVCDEYKFAKGIIEDLKKAMRPQQEYNQ